MRAQQIEKNCTLCHYEISNPICIDCLKKQVSAYLGKKINISHELNDIYNMFHSFNEAKTTCIHCGAPVEVCSFCFYNKVYKVLKKKNFNLAEEFGRLFQCDEESQIYFHHLSSSPSLAVT